MTNLFFGSVLAAVYVVMYWLLGAVLPDKYQSRSVPVMCMTGFLLYYSLFQIIALPMKITRQPLSRLTIVWGCVLLLLAAYALVRRREVLAGSIRNLFESGQKLSAVLCIAVMALAIAVLLGFNTNTISDYDSGYYIGLPVSSVYSNTLELLSPFEGKVLDRPQAFYIMNTDTLHSAVIYQALKIHPLMERKWSFTIAMVLLFEMVIYQCGKLFFQKEYAKTGVCCLFANLALLFSYSIGGVSHYFAYRTYEGKAIICYLYMTMIFCFGLALYKKEKGAWPWACLFLCTVSGISFTNTALFVVPCMAGLTLLPYILSEGICHKKWKYLVNYVIILLPGVVWLALYRTL